MLHTATAWVFKDTVMTSPCTLGRSSERQVCNMNKAVCNMCASQWRRRRLLHSRCDSDMNTIFRSILPGRADVSLSYYIHSVNTQYAVPSVQVSSNQETSSSWPKLYHQCWTQLLWYFGMTVWYVNACICQKRHAVIICFFLFCSHISVNCDLISSRRHQMDEFSQNWWVTYRSAKLNMHWLEYYQPKVCI